MIVLYSGCQIYINPAKKWPKFALVGQNSQKRPKMAKIQCYKRHAKLHIKSKLTMRGIQIS